jgi:hypothetical protein
LEQEFKKVATDDKMTKEQYVTAMKAVEKLIVDEYKKFTDDTEVIQLNSPDIVPEHASRAHGTRTSRQICGYGYLDVWMLFEWL